MVDPFGAIGFSAVLFSMVSSVVQPQTRLAVGRRLMTGDHPETLQDSPASENIFLTAWMPLAAVQNAHEIS